LRASLSSRENSAPAFQASTMLSEKNHILNLKTGDTDCVIKWVIGKNDSYAFKVF